MGKLGGFLEIEREEKKIREISDRIKDFNEIDIPLNDEYIETQAARCMDCGVPFCHWACPVDNHCPEWQDLVYNGEWKKALDLLLSTNPFPEFTGRICPALCEGSCTLGKNDKPVTTKNIELALIEKGWENALLTNHSQPLLETLILSTLIFWWSKVCWKQVILKVWTLVATQKK